MIDSSLVRELKHELSCQYQKVKSDIHTVGTYLFNVVDRARSLALEQIDLEVDIIAESDKVISNYINTLVLTYSIEKDTIINTCLCCDICFLNQRVFDIYYYFDDCGLCDICVTSTRGKLETQFIHNIFNPEILFKTKLCLADMLNNLDELEIQWFMDIYSDSIEYVRACQAKIENMVQNFVFDKCKLSTLTLTANNIECVSVWVEYYKYCLFLCNQLKQTTVIVRVDLDLLIRFEYGDFIAYNFDKPDDKHRFMFVSLDLYNKYTKQMEDYILQYFDKIDYIKLIKEE